jgi:thioredoxin-related protein
MKRILVFLAWLPVLAQAQVADVKFEQNLSWEQIKAKAKLEHKYIFVDCFATWCGPCRRMEKEVYPNGKVADYLNQNFISLKVQMDTTSSDGLLVRQWYSDAHLLQKNYSVNEFPGFLFFSPDGAVVTKSIGYKDTTGFLKMLAAALDPHRQYYTFLSNYKAGIKDYSAMPEMIRAALLLNDKGVADTMGQDYLHNYLYNLKDDQLYKEESIRFMSFGIRSSKEKAFDVFYYHSKRVDQIVGPHYSAGMVEYIIAKEDIDPYLVK